MPSDYDRAVKQMEHISKAEYDDPTTSFLHCQISGGTPSVIEPLLKQLITFHADYIGNIWKWVEPRRREDPKCIIDSQEKKGAACLKSRALLDSERGPFLHG